MVRSVVMESETLAGAESTSSQKLNLCREWFILFWDKQQKIVDSLMKTDTDHEMTTINPVGT